MSGQRLLDGLDGLAESLRIPDGIHKAARCKEPEGDAQCLCTAPAGRTGNKRLQYLTKVDESGPREPVPLI